MVLLIVIFIAIVMGILWATFTSSLLYIFYEPSKFKSILNQYAGDRHMRILRALSDGTIKPSDIRHYFNYGGNVGLVEYSPQEYRLINRLADRGECEIIEKLSGSNRSVLYKTALEIKHGKAVITRYWHAE